MGATRLLTGAAPISLCPFLMALVPLCESVLSKNISVLVCFHYVLISCADLDLITLEVHSQPLLFINILAEFLLAPDGCINIHIILLGCQPWDCYLYTICLYKICH